MSARSQPHGSDRRHHLVGLTPVACQYPPEEISADWGPVPVPVARRDPRPHRRLRSEKAYCEAEGRGFDSRHLHSCSVFELGHSEDPVERRPVLLIAEPAAFHIQAFEHRGVEQLAGPVVGLAIGIAAAGGERSGQVLAACLHAHRRPLAGHAL